MRESRVWQYLLSHLPPDLAMERVEPMYPPGLPDCFWTLRRGEPPCVSGWLELKYCEPNDPDFALGRIPKLRPEQPMFLRRQAANGVPGGILLRVGEVRWCFWKASPNHEWCRVVGGREAIQRSHNVAFRPTIGPAVLDLDRMVRLLLEPWTLV